MFGQLLLALVVQSAGQQQDMTAVARTFGDGLSGQGESAANGLAVHRHDAGFQCAEQIDQGGVIIAEWGYPVCAAGVDDQR